MVKLLRRQLLYLPCQSTWGLIVLNYTVTPQGPKTKKKSENQTNMHTWFMHGLLNLVTACRHFIFLHASWYICALYTVCRLTACVCFEGHCHVLGSGEEGALPLQQQHSFDPSLSSSHLSAHTIHREQRDKPCWHMPSVHTESQRWVEEWQGSSIDMDALDRQAGVSTEEHAALLNRWTDTGTDRQSDRQHEDNRRPDRCMMVFQIYVEALARYSV